MYWRTEVVIFVLILVKVHPCAQCCGTGTVGTVTFCRSGTGIVI
jgi:hypothetical protein